MRATLTGFLLFFTTLAAAATPGGTNVPTYHYDSLRTGWDSTETVLTPANVASANFGPTGQVALDEQVDAQPLYVSNVQIAGTAHDVIYVATENNTIYAIDGTNGVVLGSHNYGAAVPMTALPYQCTNNSDYVGIGSTPVIDLATQTLYAITYTYVRKKPVFSIHAIDITTLEDRIPPVVITGSGALSPDGHITGFNPVNNRQRAGLVEMGGKIYAGFASWCDLNSNVSRGWVMGWDATTLAPVGTGKLENGLARTPGTFFQTSVWMSGYGIASDGTSLYFSTGNSDPAGKSYNPTTNLDESVVKLSGDLSTVQDYFTPKSGLFGWSNLDQTDLELSGAGVLLLPDQPGAYPHLAIIAGKAGQVAMAGQPAVAGPMYLLNRDHLGGLGNNNVTLGAYPSYGCWCGQSYFTGSDGFGRVVQSAGFNVNVWKLRTDPYTRMVLESTSPTLNGGQSPGFFTTVSSNGTKRNTAVIWAVERPYDVNTLYVSLKAFDPANGSKLIYSAVAGYWPFAPTANANIVPVVANGKVLVASYKTLIAFGLTTSSKVSSEQAKQPVALNFAPKPALAPLPAGVAHELHGVVTAIKDNMLTLRLRNGRSVSVDMSVAKAAFAVAPVSVGHASDVRGNYKGNVFMANSILHQKEFQSLWADDR
jgi:hypothetical protein